MHFSIRKFLLDQCHPSLSHILRSLLIHYFDHSCNMARRLLDCLVCLIPCSPSDNIELVLYQINRSTLIRSGQLIWWRKRSRARCPGPRSTSSSFPLPGRSHTSSTTGKRYRSRRELNGLEPFYSLFLYIYIGILLQGFDVRALKKFLQCTPVHEWMQHSA